MERSTALHGLVKFASTEDLTLTSMVLVIKFLKKKDANLMNFYSMEDALTTALE